MHQAQMRSTLLKINAEQEKRIAGLNPAEIPPELIEDLRAKKAKAHSDAKEWLAVWTGDIANGSNPNDIALLFWDLIRQVKDYFNNWYNFTRNSAGDRWQRVYDLEKSFNLKGTQCQKQQNN